MKKKYTKKQIQESIAYWKKQLKMMSESIDITLADAQKTLNMLISQVNSLFDSGLIDEDAYAEITDGLEKVEYSLK